MGHGKYLLHTYSHRPGSKAFDFGHPIYFPVAIQVCMGICIHSKVDHEITFENKIEKPEKKKNYLEV